MNLTDLFDLSLVARRGDPALEVTTSGGTRVLTFGEIEERANRMAHLLTARGVTRGDRLGVFLANRIEFLDLYLACVRLGVVFVPINILYRERELRHIAADAEPVAIVCAEETEGLVDPFATTWLVEELARTAESQPATRVAVSLDGDDAALIVYTSGTTGTSKGAVLSHNNLIANAANLVTCWQITAADRYLAVLPLFHVHGLGNGVHSWLASGCRARLVERFEQQTAAALFEEFRPTLFFGVPTIYVRLLELPDAQARTLGASMRLFVSGSAPLPADVLDQFRDRFGHVILERYGMSETLMLASNPYAGERRAGTVGVPLPGVSMRVVDQEGQPLAAGDTGEVLVRGPNVFSGYWRRHDATEAAFADGWFRTGDIGERSADGYLTLKGRRSDLIISGGFNIYPREIEEVLLEQPGVAEAVVTGVLDPVRGEVPVAYIVSRGELDAAALESACRSQLASFKVPRAFIPVEALPRTALGKVQKHLLPPWRAR